MQKKQINATKMLWEALESQRDISTNGNVSQMGKVFPNSFLIGIRKALENGITCEELISFLAIISEIHSVLDTFDKEELMKRTSHVLTIIAGDIEYLEKQEDLMARRNRIRKTTLRKKAVKCK